MLDSIPGAVADGVGGRLLPMLVTALRGGGMAQNAGRSAVVGAVPPLNDSMLKKKA